jgi:hypothetical protein
MNFYSQEGTSRSQQPNHQEEVDHFATGFEDSSDDEVLRLSRGGRPAY